MIYGSYRVLWVCGAGNVLRVLAQHVVTGERQFVSLRFDNGQLTRKV